MAKYWCVTAWLRKYKTERSTLVKANTAKVAKEIGIKKLHSYGYSDFEIRAVREAGNF